MQHGVLLVVVTLIFGFVSVKPLFAQIVINEFSSSTTDDWVELYNLLDEEVNLSAYKLKDSATNEELLTDQVISAKGFLVVEFGRALNKDSDTVFLFENESERDKITYGEDMLPAPIDEQTIGRKTDGDGELVVFVNGSKGSSNNSLTIFNTPTPTYTITPTARNTPTSTKTPTPSKSLSPTKTPKPTKEPTESKKPTATSKKDKTPTPTAKKRPTQSVLSAKDSDISRNAPNDEDPIGEEKEKTVKVASASTHSGLYFVIGGMLLLLSCGILLGTKYKEKIFHG